MTLLAACGDPSDQLEEPPCLDVGDSSPSNDALFITDNGNEAVRRLHLDTNMVTTVVGAPPGQETEVDVLEWEGSAVDASTVGGVEPKGMAVAPNGDLYMSIPSCVLRLRDEQLSVVAGQCDEAGYAGDGGPARDSLLNNPHGLAVSPDGAWLYIADTSNGLVRAVRLMDGVDSPVF